MFDLKQFASAIAQISEEKGIPQEKLLETIEMAIAVAYKKEYGQKGQIIRAKFNPKTGDARIFQIKIVVDESMLKPETEETETPEGVAPETTVKEEAVGDPEEEKKIRFNPERHLMIEEARKLPEAKGKDLKPGDELEFELESKGDYGRIAAQTAKQVVLQRIHEAEREAVWDEYKDKEGELISGLVQRLDNRAAYIDLGKTVAILPNEEQILQERLRIGERLKFYIVSVSADPKGPGIVLSRSHPKMVSRLFELEVPEITAGTVEIKSIAREAGSRTKIAVSSNEEGIDPVGSCVGQKGTRVAAVISELGGEKIDIISWSEDSEIFVASAMSPAKVTEVQIMANRHTARVFVPEDQLSLAIGRGGQNVRLAAKLTGWKIDVIASRVTVEGVKAIKQLEELEGVGEKTAEALKKAGFLTPEDIIRASLEELTAIEGIGAKTAEKILESARKLTETSVAPENQEEPAVQEELVTDEIKNEAATFESAEVLLPAEIKEVSPEKNEENESTPEQKEEPEPENKID